MTIAAPHRIHGTRVLLVADDPQLCRRLETLLLEHQFGVDVEHDSQIAIGRLKERRYELLWLDMSEALRSDFALLKHINARNLRTVSLIADRGSSDELATNTALALGAQDIISIDDSDLEFYQASQNAMNVIRAKKRDDAQEGLDGELANFFVDNAREMTFTLDREGRFSYINSKVSETLGYSADQLLGQPLQQIVHPRQAGDIDTAFQLLQASKRAHELKLNLLRSDNDSRTEQKFFDVSIRRISGKVAALEAIPGEHCFFATASDATEQQRAKQEMMEKAFHDPLTGLPKRSLFISRLQQSLALADRESFAVAVLLIDLDGFKAVNTEQGRKVGDQVLAAAAKRLKATLRNTDTVARFGGDEFTVMLNDIKSADRARLVADKLITSLRRAFHVEGASIRVGANVGISLYPEIAADASTLIDQADEAMSIAQRDPTRNIAVFDVNEEAVAPEQPSHRDLVSFIEAADFSIRYSPVVGVKRRLIHSVEAKPHFHHAALSALSPAQFDRLIDTHKLGTEWFLATLRKTCDDLGRLGSAMSAGGLRLGIEAPASMLQEADFAERLLAQLHDRDIATEILELIIPELALEGERTTIKSQLRRLTDAGLALSIRNFGSANASLYNLAFNAVSSLRLPRQLTAHAEITAPERTVARAIAAVAAALKIDLIGEGIETLQQLQFAADLECTGAQGIILSNDLECDELAARLSSQVKSKMPPLTVVHTGSSA